MDIEDRVRVILKKHVTVREDEHIIPDYDQFESDLLTLYAREFPLEEALKEVESLLETMAKNGTLPGSGNAA